MNRRKKNKGGFFNPLSYIKEGAERIYHAIVGRDDYPKKFREMLKKYGNIPIESITIYREPIKTFVDIALNLISLGQWNQQKKNYAYDDLFHLYMIITLENGLHVRIDKNHVLETSFPKTLNDDADHLDIAITPGITINDLMNNARENVGNSIYHYNAATNNCQVFIDNVLKYSGLLTNEAHDFIMQNTEELIEELPSFTQKIINSVTDLASRGDILLHGRSFYFRLPKKNIKKANKRKVKKRPKKKNKS